MARGWDARATRFDAGAKYCCLTTLHALDFCIFKTEQTHHASKRDYTRELSAACRKAGLGCGMDNLPPLAGGLERRSSGHQAQQSLRRTRCGDQLVDAALSRFGCRRLESSGALHRHGGGLDAKRAGYRELPLCNIVPEMNANWFASLD